MDPLIILLIGVIVVIGMIIVLRVNAFVALISAAILISLLSGGDLTDKVSRVAGAFGSVVGAIGIVIALAAVIGKCLMDSGAADRIVRAFLRVLGEKRSSTALMGSGFVLSVPVFFDTVFYLLVPLARSLYRRTRKNYLLYVTAIVTGAALTHTLVPPTPGPLFAADRLNVDVGLLILMGVIIALPTAFVGLLVCRIINRLMDVPMRPYSGVPEPEPLEDHQLPSLFASLLPVILPVILISANTVATTLANSAHAARFRSGDILNWSTFATTLANAGNEGPAARVMQWLPAEVQEIIRQGAVSGTFTPEEQEQIRSALNVLLTDPKRNEKTKKVVRFYQDEDFMGYEMPGRDRRFLLPAPARALLKKGLSRKSQAEVEHFNRLVLEEIFGKATIAQHQWETDNRKVANVTALLGNPNLALLISAATALFVLRQKRRLSLKELGQTAETALLSGGIIILITAGGGAFGAMLREAGIDDKIRTMVGTGSQFTGITILLAAAATATVVKFAQGSGTVSIITTASIFGAFGFTGQDLGCHPVYLAMAIGSGSLVGDWMNNSGFWIFAKMSGLTEAETLKSWTILLAIVGIVGLGFTLLASTLVPLL